VSRNLSRSQAVLLGIVVLAALSLGAVGLVVLGDRNGWGGDSIRFLVAFADINGVEVGTRVRIQGMDAGEIEAVIPPEKPGEPVRLRLRIVGKYRHLLRDDAKVQIVSESLLAGKIVRILPGSLQAKLLADHGELKGDVQPDTLEGITQAAAKLNSVLSKADSALGSIDKGEGTLGKLVKDDKFYKELTETLLEVKLAIAEVRGSDGAVASLQEVRRMVNSVKQNSDAIKSMPLVRSYIVDYAKELIRPDCDRQRIWYAEKDLFEPGKAVLTANGKAKLDDAAQWLNKHKQDGSEILIAAFAEPSQLADFAQTVTQKQSEVVADYLRTKKVHHNGWWWWSTRPIRSLGCGNNPTPVPEIEKMPAARIEVIVFAPRR
jgi:phospholipid/cholesterol/gamma-HCH transport system substrate-binding protein